MKLKWKPEKVKWWRNKYSTKTKNRNIEWINKASIIKMIHYKISKLLNDSAVWKFVTKKIDSS